MKVIFTIEAKLPGSPDDVDWAALREVCEGLKDRAERYLQNRSVATVSVEAKLTVGDE